MSHRILLTGASSGFGLLTSHLLAEAGHTVYGGLFSPSGDTSQEHADANKFAEDHKVKLIPIGLDVTSDTSVETAVNTLLKDGPIDIVIHNAGRAAFGPAESFTPEQLHQILDINYVGPHRLNRALLPHMRRQGRGLIIWVSSGGKNGVTPLSSPYAASKAALDSMACAISAEIAPWGIETSIVTPGVFPKGTNAFPAAMKPGLPEIVQVYEQGALKGVREQMGKGFQQIAPPDQDPMAVAEAIEKIVASPRGQRPFRVTVDPVNNGSEEVNKLADEKFGHVMQRLGLREMCALRV